MKSRTKENTNMFLELNSALVREQRCHDWSYLMVRLSAKLRSFEISQNEEVYTKRTGQENNTIKCASSEGHDKEITTRTVKR